MNPRVHMLVESAGDPLQFDGPNVVRGLAGSPKRVSSVYVYDRRGTALFERQCATEEYYLRRTEARLLSAHASDIVQRCGPLPIVELGAGTADKTRTLLAEYARRRWRCDYFAVDVDTATLMRAAHRLVREFSLVHVHCLGTTYARGLGALRALRAGRGATLFLFLGSSIANMELHEIDELLAQLHAAGRAGDYLLVGADLSKDAAVIDRAYNDSLGYGPRSTLNILTHLNRRYGGNFNLNQFRYRSSYNAREQRNQVWIQSTANQAVTLSRLEITVALACDECIEAEVMWKFDPARLSDILSRAGFLPAARWIEPIPAYGLFLMRRQ